MKLKTYSAGSMAQALAEVKKDLGKDAVILHTRVYKSGAVMGVGGRQVVEITASSQAPGSPTPTARPIRTAPARPAETAPAFAPSRFQTLTVPTSDLPPSHSVEVKQPSGPQRLAVQVDPAPVDSAGLAALREDLAAIRRLVGVALARTPDRTPSPAALPGSLAILAARLQDEALSPDSINLVLNHLRDEFKADDASDLPAVESTLLRHLAALIQTIGRVTPAGPQPDARPLTIALVGPTGVGKTTTIAKLAAAYKLRMGKRVGLVTCDTYRIAAVEQLRTYAGIIDLPMKVALAAEEVGEACRALHDCDVVILDTPGRSHNDSARVDELSQCVQAARPHETHLVLSAAVGETVLMRAADAFLRVRPDRILITKLDEAVQTAPVINLARKVNLPFSYLTTGQEVPDQIELARPARLAELILRGAWQSLAPAVCGVNAV